ncbi:oxidoreductase domain-containing protein [Halovivax asiaticus JCM 14624]|uniref:Oxidoreductase domain-containing protein n=1 Tax=Halovivax asiaticus JCM 14624 TaxID=1227490 RepID=M0BMX0_9EURY|nr:Gfo/Idh/MocA family oxidoreductase [Halovivax asiaticus]ELZ11638.1 oxidoreductase domain-containing protein [Halovivax asiaticus JCM 14624]
MYQVGIVGCGVIGSRLAAAFDEHERTEIRVVCDRVARKAESMADEYDCEAVTDVDELVAIDAVDVVYVGVPPKHHAAVVRAALDADTHVVCEKPIAETATVGRELTELVRESDRTTAINLPFRYTPGFVDMRERIAAGEIGSPKRVSLRFRFPQWPREWQDVDWLAGREQGGPLREVGSHFVFATQELFGTIGDVTADVRYTGPETYEESIVGTFRAGGDVVGVGGDVGSVGGNVAGARGGEPGREEAAGVESDAEPTGAVAVDEPVHGTIDLLCDCAGSEVNAITVEGTEGSLSLQAWRRLVADPGEETERVLTEDPGETTLTLVDEFVTALDGGDGDLVSVAEATRVQAVVDAVLGIDAD